MLAAQAPLNAGKATTGRGPLPGVEWSFELREIRGCTTARESGGAYKHTASTPKVARARVKPSNSSCSIEPLRESAE